MKTLFSIINGQVAEGRVISYMKWCDSYEMQFAATINNKEKNRIEHYYPRKILKSTQVFQTRQAVQDFLDNLRKQIAEAQQKAKETQESLEKAKSEIESHENS